MLKVSSFSLLKWLDPTPFSLHSSEISRCPNFQGSYITVNLHHSKLTCVYFRQPCVASLWAWVKGLAKRDYGKRGKVHVMPIASYNFHFIYLSFQETMLEWYSEVLVLPWQQAEGSMRGHCSYWIGTFPGTSTAGLQQCTVHGWRLGGIQNLQCSIKVEKFRIGFNTVYHITGNKNLIIMCPSELIYSICYLLVYIPIHT